MTTGRTLPVAVARPGAAGVLSTNRVLRNTYGLLSLTLFFSAATAAASAALQLPHPGLLLTLAGFFGLLFLTTKLRDSGWGVLSVFGLTGFMGYTLGPIVAQYLAMPNGHQVVMMAMGGTATIFVALSAYALVSRRDFSFMGGFLLAGIVTMTPGTVSADLSDDRRTLLVHGLAIDDEAALIRSIKTRYEAPLKEIFACSNM